MQMVGDEGWIAGFDGVILHTTDGGKTWTKQNTGVTLSLEALFFLDAKNGWAVGWAGTILHTTDGGSHVEAGQDPGPPRGRSARSTFRDAKNGLISGFAGQLVPHQRMAAPPGRPSRRPTPGWLTSIAFDGANRGWITTDDGFLMSTDGGETWKLHSRADGNADFPQQAAAQLPAPPGRSVRSAC